MNSIRFLPVLLLIIHCQSTVKKPANQSSKISATNIGELVPCDTENCTHQINTIESFGQFGMPIKIAGRTQRVVKFLYNRNPSTREGTVYFFNTPKYEYHYNFATQYLNESGSVSQFNSNYVGNGQERTFNLGSLIYYSIQNADETHNHLIWEIWNGDTLSGTYLEELKSVLEEKISISELGDLKFHPLSKAQEIEATSLSLNTISTADLFKGLDFITLNPGEAIGKVTIVDDLDSMACVDHSNLVVYRKTPNDLGLVAGVVTEEPQTPLSHINVKSINRGTLNMYIKDASQILKDYENEYVHIISSGDTYTIARISLDEYQAMATDFWESRRPNFSGSFTPNLSLPPSGGLINLVEYFSNDSNTSYVSSLQARIPRSGPYSDLINQVGAKAANLGVISAIIDSSALINPLDIKYPKALGVPFYFFEKFMSTPQLGIDPSNPDQVSTPAAVVRDLLEERDMLNPNTFKSICGLKTQLEKIRQVIKSAKVPEELLAAFKKELFDNPNSPIHQSKIPRVRIRSSTNSEDLEGFTGAGLYDSDGVSLYKRYEDRSFIRNKPKDWEKVQEDLIEIIPSLYSSVWNDRAFAEREWFRINGENHLKIKVGFAVHQAFPRLGFEHEPGELANGVMVSDDIYDEENDWAVYINSQHLDMAVTNPPTAEELEEIGEDPNANYLTEEILVTTLTADPQLQNSSQRWKYYSFNILSESSILQGKPTLIDNTNPNAPLGQAEIRRLGFLGEQISNAFANLLGRDPSDFSIDTEWKVYGTSREIWLKQARPFK